MELENKLIEYLEVKNLYLSEYCNRLQQLLRPWKLRAQEPQSENGNSKGDTNADSKEVSQKETKELELMDSLLSKAQKTMKKHEKRMQLLSEECSNENSVSSSNEDSVDHQIKNECLQMKGHLKESPITQDENPQPPQKAVSFVKKETQNNCKSVGRLSKPTSNNRIPASFGSTSGSEKTSSVKHVTDSSAKRTQSSRSLGRGKQYKPAHVSAPFKTNPSLPAVPKRSKDIGTHVFKKDKNKTDTGMAVNRKQSQSYIQEKRGKTENSQLTSSDIILSNENEKDDEGVVQGKQVSATEDEDSACTQETNGNSNSQCRDFDKTCSREILKGKKSPREICHDEVKSIDVQEEEESFCLKKNGGSINFPNKLKKMYSTNTRLRQRLQQALIVKKVDTISCRESFKASLLHTFSGLQEQALGTKQLALGKIYQKLLQMLFSLNLEQLHEESSPYCIIRAKSILEVILVHFYDLEQTRENLNTGNETGQQRVSPSRFCGKRSNTKLLTPLPQPTSMQCHNFLDLDTFQRHPTILQYRSCRQLEQYWNLFFQVQFQTIYLGLLEEIKKLFFPIMKTLESSNSEILPVYRGLQALLSWEEVTPVIVHDTVETR